MDQDSRTVAALYVDLLRGPYGSLDGVDCWGFASRNGKQVGLFVKDRDARLYEGPSPVIAHPPCGPWGRFWWNYKGGEGDQICGLRAVDQVREWGGVLEHPAQSRLWTAAGIPGPAEGQDHCGGWTLEVQQCDWGHAARKPTWLYICGTSTVPPAPDRAEPTRVMVRLLRNNNDMPEVPKADRHLTPLAFARWLVSLARMCRVRD